MRTICYGLCAAILMLTQACTALQDTPTIPSMGLTQPAMSATQQQKHDYCRGVAHAAADKAKKSQVTKEVVGTGVGVVVGVVAGRVLGSRGHGSGGRSWASHRLSGYGRGGGRGGAMVLGGAAGGVAGGAGMYAAGDELQDVFDAYWYECMNTY